MNEPANFDTNKEKPFNWPKDREPWNLFCPTNKSLDNPIYTPLAARQFGDSTLLSDKTVCMITTQGENEGFNHYDVHNLYGWSQTQPTLEYDFLKDSYKSLIKLI
jgi:maltase-glucoamylase